jgi:hypothetical protein
VKGPPGEAFVVPTFTSSETQRLHIWERQGSRLEIESPDVVAAQLIHEMIHWTQENYGYGQGRYGVSDPMHIAQHWLNELMAYDKCSAHSFYWRALSGAQRQLVLDSGLSYSIGRFNEAWAQVPAEQRKELARWAWSLKDGWMRSAMEFYPGENGGVWGRLCAANQGVGPCGMVRR